MKKRRISAEVAEFISRQIDSVHTLEVLLLLFQDPAQGWTVEAVHDRVKSSAAAVQKSLQEMVAAGLAEETNSTSEVRYSLKPSSVLPCIVELAEAYAERSAAVIEIIYSKPAHAGRRFSRLG